MGSPCTPRSQYPPALASMMNVVAVLTSLVHLHLLCFSHVAMGWLCRDFCGPVQVKYPFGTGPGCGDPRFHKYITCQNQRQLFFTTHSGSYPIQYIDYSKLVIYINDPIMSTCNSMHPSSSFALDWAAPFRLKNDVFVLLGCSPTSPLYDPHNYLCDIGSSSICTNLYACPGIGGLELPLYAPITSCCVYSPINLGPAVDLNLPGLQCLSYTSIYSFGSDPTNPSQWRYGVALEYNYNIDNHVPGACRDCEESNGVCGYAGPYDTFVCVCRNGVNTTTSCHGQDRDFWDKALRQRPTSIFSIAGVISVVSVLLL